MGMGFPVAGLTAWEPAWEHMGAVQWLVMQGGKSMWLSDGKGISPVCFEPQDRITST